MTRAAIYARYSSDLQKEASIGDQVQLCRSHAEAGGIDVVEVFTDHAISGGHLKTRSGAMSLMDRAREGAFDVVLVESLDRLSRDQEDIAAIFKRLTHAGVAIRTVTEGEINELHIGLKGTMNALFLKDLAVKTRRGQAGQVLAGKIPGGNSYGYRIVRELKSDGTVTTGDRAIDETQAQIVRRIFTAYASGQPPRRIAAELNREGVLGPRGGPWNASTINGSRQRRNGILNNELYLGRIVYNRQRFAKDPESGKRVSRPNPEQEWLRKDVPHLRIIDDATWERVQSIKARYASQAGNKRQTKKRLLSGLVRCGSCGGSMTIVNRERYSCSARRERGTCTSPAGIAATALEDRVLNGLRSILIGNAALIDEFAKAFRAELDRLRKTRGSRGAELQSELAKVERGIQRCLDFIVEGEGDPRSVATTLKDLEARKTVLDADLRKVADNTNVDIHPNVGELYRRKVGELQAFLADETTRAEAMEGIRELIERIEVHPGVKRGQPEVILVGALASLLDFACAETTTAANGGSVDGGRVLMVAGVGFEPTTFRL
ncbi:recombinase family protein [Ruegeria atlantica]|uniref:recombinase family protein n=1 Tax=Ruegeria atlantica TaxID=81569 RepID=UPI0024951A18|nr:recombinase family protein [Ruegeria atlantica]